ncbi:MAG: 50S ribosomal protein L23 [Gammaproteobacteria bacterium]|nr:50S ribosomal protein L23 [Gammaproteobacteria bacterium]MCY4217930.1 50S ribosomal protein L23 [Gammaproteobacteria bacterium]MCY4274206.1 50S ribosomal protein L23 [Gammaproteobacteria bacterium]
MNQERLYQIIVEPVISEKSTGVGDKSQMVLKVLPNANKKEIRKAVETLFKLKVKRVQVANVRGKAKTFGRVKGKQNDWKKAYVCLEPGQDFDFHNMDI